MGGGQEDVDVKYQPGPFLSIRAPVKHTGQWTVVLATATINLRQSCLPKHWKRASYS